MLKVQRVRQELRVHKVIKVQLDLVDQQVLKVLQERLVLKVLLVRLDHKEPQVLRVLKDIKVIQVIQDQQVLRVMTQV